MVIESAWETLFILGIILASSLLPFLIRYPFFFFFLIQCLALSQAVIIAVITFSPESLTLQILPVLCMIAVLSLGELAYLICLSHGRQTMLMRTALFALALLPCIFYRPQSLLISVVGWHCSALSWPYTGFTIKTYCIAAISNYC